MEEGRLTPATATAAIRFRIGGALRFLSHAETARVWQRACARADIPVRYSQGFNPHPRMSLPLPRPVGVAAEEEMLVVKLCAERQGAPVEDRAEQEKAWRQALAEQLPEGIEVLAVDCAAHGSFQPQSAEYVLPLGVDDEADRAKRVRERIAEVMEKEHCTVERLAAPGGVSRSIDVRPFLQAIRLEGGTLIVQHRTGGAGSIRIEEILRLFGLSPQDLTGPIRRANVVWETTESDKTAKEPCMETRAEDCEDGT
jgi:radical SAM-linked protein